MAIAGLSGPTNANFTYVDTVRITDRGPWSDERCHRNDGNLDGKPRGYSRLRASAAIPAPRALPLLEQPAPLADMKGVPMQKFTTSLALSLLLGLAALSDRPQAQQPAYHWQTTFNCPDWTQGTPGVTQLCSASEWMTPGGNWTTSNGSRDQITLAANNPAGGGGKGLRHWRGAGRTNNGGGVQVSLPVPVREMWLRWYMRYQAGFSFSTLNMTKDLYVNVSGSQGAIFTMGFHWADNFGVGHVSNQSGNQVAYCPPGWQSVMGGSTGDGKWHAYEFHVKMDTNGRNGIAETWVDGKRSCSFTDVDWGTTGAWTHFLIGSNQADIANGPDVYTDYDDFALSLTGYIGPLGGSAPTTTAPAAPANLRISQ